LRPGGRIRPHRPVADLNNTTINKRKQGRGLERPGDGVAPSFFEGNFCRIFGRGGGRIEVAICDRAGELDRTARSPTSTTQQSTSVRGVGGWNGRGMVWRLRFSKGIFVEFLGGGGGRIEVVICDRAGELDRTAQSPTSTTQQSTSVSRVGGWTGRGMVWRLRFSKGIFVEFLGGGGVG
jgi:hypothetical protein